MFGSRENWLWGCIYILFSLVSSSTTMSLRCLKRQSILSCFFLFVSRYLYADPLHCNMAYLLIRLLKDDLKEYTYAARLSGLVYAFASGMNAILVSKMKKSRQKWDGLRVVKCSLENVWLVSKQNSYWFCVPLHIYKYIDKSLQFYNNYWMVWLSVIGMFLCLYRVLTLHFSLVGAIILKE